MWKFWYNQASKELDTPLPTQPDLNTPDLMCRLADLEAANLKLKQLILLTDPVVENDETNDLSLRQWAEFTRWDIALKARQDPSMTNEEWERQHLKTRQGVSEQMLLDFVEYIAAITDRDGEPTSLAWEAAKLLHKLYSGEQATQVYPACSDCGKEIRKTPPKQVFVCKECAAKSRQVMEDSGFVESRLDNQEGDKK